ncbi:MAG: WecB/TagA/CpsF family glycosyltransferase [Bacillota bacterium]
MRPPHGRVLGVRVDATSFADAVSRIGGWANGFESRYVVVANVHVAMMAHDDPAYREIVNNADLVTPDGMPLVWALRVLGFKQQERVHGARLVLDLCNWAAANEAPVFFYGSTPETLAALRRNLLARFPNLRIAGMYSPPFRPLSPAEDEADVKRINASGAHIVFVGLGAPKQERWMAAHRGRVNAVMLGVGAAFDILAGRIKQAPAWMQRSGLEWLYRLLKEPRRLWWRYLYYNPRYLALLSLQLLGLKKF